MVSFASRFTVGPIIYRKQVYLKVENAPDWENTIKKKGGMILERERRIRGTLCSAVLPEKGRSGRYALRLNCWSSEALRLYKVSKDIRSDGSEWRGQKASTHSHFRVEGVTSEGISNEIKICHRAVINVGSNPGPEGSSNRRGGIEKVNQSA